MDNLLGTKWQIEERLPTNTYFPNHLCLALNFSNIHKSTLLKIGNKDVSTVEPTHCISISFPLASRNEAEFYIIIPVSVAALADVIVVNTVAIVKTRQLFMKRVMRAELISKMPRGNIRSRLAKFPKEGLLHEQGLTFRKSSCNDPDDRGCNPSFSISAMRFVFAVSSVRLKWASLRDPFPSP
jgi:hypothetical protein